ncbi:MAG: transposase [Gammaproteobacteria bacterium]
MHFPDSEALVGHARRNRCSLEAWNFFGRLVGCLHYTYHVVRSVRGIGRILTLVILYEIEDIHRFPTVQQFVSYARLIKCSKESAGKTYGYSGRRSATPI